MGNALVHVPAEQRTPEITMGKDEARVFNWRVEQLVQAGVHFELAEEACRDRHYDYRVALRMIAEGCPPDLAVEITR